MISIHSTLGWSKIFMYENSILHKAAIVPLQKSDFVAKFESNCTYLGGKTKFLSRFNDPGMKKSTVMLCDCCCQTKIRTKTLKNDVFL